MHRLKTLLSYPHWHSEETQMYIYQGVVINYGGKVGYKAGGGGASEVLPLIKRGGGAGKVLAIL